MTPMDSDSESQDSDEGRRFRFETTRKDPVAPVDTSSRSNPPEKKSKSHKSSRCEDSSRHYRDRKERSKHDSARKTDNKDLRHLIKHVKYESWSNSRQEDGSKNSHKDRDVRDVSAANDRGSRHSSGGGDARERSRESKRQSDRDWSVHRAQRSREHSYERNHDELRGSGDKHRSRCRERHKHRSQDRSRERSHQSTKIKSSSGDRSREDYGKPDSSRKLSVKENRSQNSRDCSSPKSVGRVRSHSCESRSTLEYFAGEDVRKESSLDTPDCKELDLSLFDVLSETDENTSDGPDSRCRTLSLRHRETMREHDSSGDQSESHEPPQKQTRTEERERRKVKTRDDDDGDEDNDESTSGSSHNNPSAVSDSPLVSSATNFAKTRDARADLTKERAEYREEDAERSTSRERHSRHSAAVSNDTRLFEYGSLLVPELALCTFVDEEFKMSSSSKGLDNSHHHNSRKRMIDDNDERTTMRLIGPCLPPSDEFRASDQRERGVAEHDVSSEEATFGPALPPHLLQRKRDNESRDRIIGPVLPDTVKKASCETVESDDEQAIGPLPVDHPALRNSRVHEQLEMRAHKIRHKGYSEEVKKINQDYTGDFKIVRLHELSFFT